MVAVYPVERMTSLESVMAPVPAYISEAGENQLGAKLIAPLPSALPEVTCRAPAVIVVPPA